VNRFLSSSCSEAISFGAGKKKSCFAALAMMRAARQACGDASLWRALQLQWWRMSACDRAEVPDGQAPGRFTNGAMME
jgi:hypothetical protein